MKKLSVIIVNYNVCYFLEQALKSVLKSAEGLDVEIIVVDNNSVDGSVQMMKEKFPDIKLIASDENLGFSKANNLAMRQAKGEYILLLNPDTVIEEQTLSKCCEFMDDHKDAGGLGVKMVDGKGHFLPESKRGLPTPWIAFYKIFGLARFFPKSKKFGKYHLGYLDKNKTHEIEVLSGAFMMMRKSVLDEIGLLDEDYFMYGEDIDLSYRIVKAGYKNYYYPETTIIHYKGESTKRTSINYVFIFYKAMIIFAKKHFAGKSAKTFAFLINIAIYAKAGFEIAKRLIKKAVLPLSDAAIIFGGLYFLKEYWEANHKYVLNYVQEFWNNGTPSVSEYPWQILWIAFPSYIAVWLLSVYFSGGYDKPVKASRIVRGVLIGTILIAAGTNFLSNDLRFSRALIILGAAWTVAALILSRLIIQLVKYKNLHLGQEKIKRIAIIGSESESARVTGLLKDFDKTTSTVGHISLNTPNNPGKDYLGNLKQINEIIEIYDINEIVFCSKDIPANKIIEWMTRVNNKLIDFKIVPDESNYVIGSNSKVSAGEFYTVNIELNLLHKSTQRNKRVLDIMVSLLFILLSPILMWFTKKPLTFLKNCLTVLGGRRTWVSFSSQGQHNLPRIRPGIITPSSYIKQTNLDQNTIKRLDMLYARDYRPSFDISLLIKSFRNLGRSI